MSSAPDKDAAKSPQRSRPAARRWLHHSPLRWHQRRRPPRRESQRSPSPPCYYSLRKRAGPSILNTQYTSVAGQAWEGSDTILQEGARVQEIADYEAALLSRWSSFPLINISRTKEECNNSCKLRRAADRLQLIMPMLN